MRGGGELAGSWGALQGPLRSCWALQQEVLRAFPGKPQLPGLSLTFHPKKGQGLKEANTPGWAQPFLQVAQV